MQAATGYGVVLLDLWRRDRASRRCSSDHTLGRMRAQAQVHVHDQLGAAR